MAAMGTSNHKELCLCSLGWEQKAETSASETTCEKDPPKNRILENMVFLTSVPTALQKQKPCHQAMLWS